MNTKHHILLAAVVLLAAVWEFGPAVNAGFVYQDVRWQSAFEAAPDRLPTNPNRILMRWSWWLQSWYTPLPAAFHAVSLVMHLVASLMVARLVWLLRVPPLGVWVAFIVFLLNPIQLETVAYLSGRTEMFAATGVLATCIALVGKVTPVRLVVAAAAFGFGLLGKETAIVLLVILPAIRRNWFAALVMLLLIAEVSVLAPVVVEIVNHHYENLTVQSALNIISWASTQALAECRVLFTALTQVGSAVDWDYRLPLSVKLTAVGVIFTVACVGWLLRHTQPLLTTGIFIVVSVWVPRMLVITPGSNFNEHQFYLGMLGVSLVAANTATYLVSKWEAPHEFEYV